MTAAVVGVFLLIHFDAAWYWYAWLAGAAALEIHHTEKFRDYVQRMFMRMHDR